MKGDTSVLLGVKGLSILFRQFFETQVRKQGRNLSWSWWHIRATQLLMIMTIIDVLRVSINCNTGQANSLPVPTFKYVK